MLDVSRLIQVIVNLTTPGALGRTFNDLLVMGDSNVITGLQRERSYQSLAGVAADFGTTAPEYLAALLYYEQVPKPLNITIGRWLRTATAGELQGAILTAAQQALINFTQITSGGFDITINGTVYDLTGMNFSTALNLNGVASIVTTALSGAGTCIWDGFQFEIVSSTTGAGIEASGTITLTANPSPGDTVTVNGIVITFVSSLTGANQVLIGGTDQITAANLNAFLINSTSPNILEASYTVSGLVVTVTFNQVGTVGDAFTLAKSSAAITLSGANLAGGTNASSVSYATSPASGQDVSSILGLTAALALPLVPGYAAETPLQAVVALDALDTNWYGLTFAASAMPTDSDNIAIAGFIEADIITRLFGVTIQNTNVLSSEVTNDLASELMALGYSQTFTAYCSTNPYSVASVFGRLFTVNLSGSNTFIDLCYKQMPGIVAENLNTDEANVLQAKRCNVFASYDNGTSIFQYGVCSGPAFIDETYGDNALQNTIQTDVYNVLYTSPTKVPQTDQGMQQFTNAISQACQQFVTNGFGAPGVWNASGFGSLQMGGYLKTGYYIYAPSIASQSESDRAARKSVPFQVAFKEAGSTQTVFIQVEVNQ
jgi:Protein of unknown function (DUF3383)